MQLFRTTFKAMGGMNEIVVAAGGNGEATAAMEAAAREVLRIETKYSRYRSDDGSIVHRINAAAGGPSAVACDAETAELLRTAARLYDMSGGLFDITSGVLRRAWDFSKPVVPSSQQVSALLALIGWDRIEFRGDSIRLPEKGMEIDFGGFGKEYAADRAAAVIAARGIRHGYVSLGGDIRAVGGNPDGAPWRFGVRDPRNPEAVIANIDVTDGALATSGDYEKFIKVDGRAYGHILSPRTGFPVDCWRSVSVSSVNAISAGALTTIAMLKEAEAVPFLDNAHCGYLLVDGAGRILTNTKQSKSEQA